MNTQLAVCAELRSFHLQREHFSFMLLHPAITGMQWQELLKNAWTFHNEKPPLITGFDWKEKTYVALIAIERMTCPASIRRITHQFGSHIKELCGVNCIIIDMPHSVFDFIEEIVKIVRYPTSPPSLN